MRRVATETKTARDKTFAAKEAAKATAGKVQHTMCLWSLKMLLYQLLAVLGLMAPILGRYTTVDHEPCAPFPCLWSFGEFVPATTIANATTTTTTTTTNSSTTTSTTTAITTTTSTTTTTTTTTTYTTTATVAAKRSSLSSHVYYQAQQFDLQSSNTTHFACRESLYCSIEIIVCETKKCCKPKVAAN